MTAAVPIPATSLLPIVLFPLTNSLELSETTSAYGSGTIFLFMGGFMIALAMEKWNLHRRIALTIISVVGTNTNMIILGFIDRKSTRLNSSHVAISYAVFCLKKK